MAHAAIPDHIFVQTDLTFDYVLQAIKELREQGRIRETHAQKAFLSGSIQGNNEIHEFQFGGGTMNPAAAFGRTASAVVRMVMLEAVQIQRGLWPQFGPEAMRRNKRQLGFSILHGEKFVLASELQDARHYWAKYDQIYPHFWIEDQVSGNKGANCNMPSMMLIIRNNFTEIVEITTTFRARWIERNVFESSVNVLCIVREVCNIEGKADEKYTKKIKSLLMQSQENRKTDLEVLFSNLALEMPANVNKD